MQRQDLRELLPLAAIWGASYLFMRLGAGEFGAVPLAGLRAAIAAVVLLPLLLWRGEWAVLRRHWKPIAVVGLGNSALPFVCFSYAALTINAGLSSIFSAATPLFAAAIGWLWLKDRLGTARVIGLLIGLVGVFGLAWSKAGFKPGTDGAATALAVAACLLATLAYGFSVNFTKKHLAGVPPMATAAGGQLAAALALAVPALWWWPAATPGALAWGSVLLLAVLCTALAYVLFFRLIARVGPANATTVTFLVPAFAVAWGALFLGESLTLQMLLGCAVIFAGTALATGLLPRAGRKAGAPNAAHNCQSPAFEPGCASHSSKQRTVQRAQIAPSSLGTMLARALRLSA